MTTLTPFILTLANALDLPLCIMTVAFDVFLPWMIGATALCYLGMELHYRALCRSLEWDEPTYRTISRPVECEPIWEHIQPDWRAA
jgi:hypothetical protein